MEAAVQQRVDALQQQVNSLEQQLSQWQPKFGRYDVAIQQTMPAWKTEIAWNKLYDAQKKAAASAASATNELYHKADKCITEINEVKLPELAKAIANGGG